jgi:hypothetical protein
MIIGIIPEGSIDELGALAFLSTSSVLPAQTCLCRDVEVDHPKRCAKLLDLIAVKPDLCSSIKAIAVQLPYMGGPDPGHDHEPFELLTHAEAVELDSVVCDPGGVRIRGCECCEVESAACRWRRCR